MAIQKKIFSEDNLKYYCAFTHLNGVSALFKAKLFEYFDYDIEHAFKCEKGELLSFSDEYPEVRVSRSFFSKRKEINPQKVLDEALEKEYKILTYGDKKYPELLKEIPDYPLMLYYKGEMRDFNNCIAVVGSRNASETAKEALSHIISGMRGADVTIVSGLAYGIDTQAHKSAAKNELPTIAVIGSGLDYTYPVSNKNLYREIEEGAGVIFSEYSPSTPPLAHNFPQRNRIVTGLSLGTLVAEAAIKSGAMISANLTLEQNRELMCMPGLISNPNTEGVYKLLKNGASLVTSAEDIFECLNLNFKASENKIELKGLEKNIFDTIKIEPENFDILSSKLNVETQELMVCLTQMELKGLIKQINSRYYISN